MILDPELPRWIAVVAGTPDNPLTVALDIARIHGASHWTSDDTLTRSFVIDTHQIGSTPLARDYWATFFRHHQPEPLPHGEWRCIRCGDPVARHVIVNRERRCDDSFRKSLVPRKGHR